MKISEMLEIGTKVQMVTTKSWWTKGDIGHITHIRDSGYIICFDSSCKIKHTTTGGHAWWATPSSFEPIEFPQKLMIVD